MNSDMEIVQADQSRIPAVMQVLRSCTNAMRQAGIFQWDEVYPSREVVEEDVRAGSLYLGLEKGVCIAAMALDEKQEAAYRQVKWHGAEPVLVVHRLCIAPDRQKKGIAGMFMDFAEDFALQSGYAGIRLDAYSGNPAAVRLYESRGYRKVGEVNFPRRDLPFYCYEKTFPSFMR